MPPAGKAPWIEVKTAVIASDWLKMLENPRHSDVTFVVDGSRELNAHQVVLCSASKFFRKVFSISLTTEVLLEGFLSKQSIPL